jgi:hypothetical protein
VKPRRLVENRQPLNEEALQFRSPWRWSWDAGESRKVWTLQIKACSNKTVGSRKGVDEVEEEQMMTLVRRNDVSNLSDSVKLFDRGGPSGLDRIS